MENTVINTLHNLIDYDISEFLSAEVELKNSLPKWIEQANSFQLKRALQKYLDFVDQHIESIGAFINERQIMMTRESNPVMLALIKDLDERLSYCTNVAVKDACLLGGIQGIIHYKISIYGTASAFAGLLELTKDTAIFYEAEINEKHIDDLLSQLAIYEINNKAKSAIALPN